MNRRIFCKMTAALGALALVPMAASAAPSPEPLRQVDVYTKGTWTPVEWAGLKRGHIFRLREPDTGAIVDAGTPSEISLAVEDATFVGGAALWCVKGEPFTTIDTVQDQALRALGFNLRVMKDGRRVGLVHEFDLRTHTCRKARLLIEMLEEGEPWALAITATKFDVSAIPAPPPEVARYYPNYQFDYIEVGTQEAPLPPPAMPRWWDEMTTSESWPSRYSNYWGWLNASGAPRSLRAV